jgi:hypothetical protein
VYLCVLGDINVLKKFHVPLGGDQLTRVRLQEAKNLRCLATSPASRFEYLEPIVVELWHIKQDMLEVHRHVTCKTWNY